MGFGGCKRERERENVCVNVGGRTEEATDNKEDG